MSLRKEKAAKLKLHILTTALKMVGKRPFEDLFVDDVCERVKISKVTFFKYFPCKEDLLLYYFRVWCLERSVETADKKREGLQGIYYLFDKLSDSCEAHPGVMLSLIGYISDFKRPPKPFPLKPEEKVLMFPDVADVQSVEILSIEQRMEQYVLEAIFRKEITKVSSTKDLTALFLTLFYGAVIVAHLNQMNPAKFFFRRNLDMLVQGLR
jgi:AcrR family transcriptional regulator